MIEETSQQYTDTYIPDKPFDDFKWRWAVTTPSEGLNNKIILFGVLDVLVKHNGKRHATKEFRDDLISLENSITDSRVSLSKKEDKHGNPRPLEKNIIENSGQYWKALGLINTTSDGTIDVTKLGLSIINDKLSDIDFLREEIRTFILPNKNIEDKETIKKFEQNNIKIMPLALLIRIYAGLVHTSKAPTGWYLKIDELAKIIVPLSAKETRVSIYVEHILKYRDNPKDYDSWPNCTQGVNDERMLKEYLLFLRNFNALTELSIKDEKNSRFYVNETTLNLINEFGTDILEATDNTTQNNHKASNVIFFGSPGTGKSNKADERTKNSNVRKVTFHPEYDYSNFVGGFKPSMENNKISYKFVPQIFTKIYIDAWKNPEEHFYLQIEEINRGNCAEIFGDLFQLLDRDTDGSSKYSVDASEDLLIHLIKELGEQHNGIKDGKIKLPNNLSLIATMNTSDQSLFPMDSAFKRRWDWEYIRIDYECSNSNFTIKLNNGLTYEWLKFLEAVNRVIFETTESMDKQIGNWFINARNTNNTIDEKTFINKVIFYLWNDVFKDEDEGLFTIGGDKITYEDFFTAKNNDSKLIQNMISEHLELIAINEIIEENVQDK
jgi:hypothetical protein